MTKRKPFLTIFLITSLIIVIVAAVLAMTVGLSLGTDVGGGVQFEVKVENGDNFAAQKNDINSVLSKNGLRAEKIFIEDKGVDTVIVVRLYKSEVKDTLRQEVADKLKVDVDSVSQMNKISGVVTKKAVLWASVTIVCLLLAIFVAGWLRYKVMAGFTLMFTVLHALLFAVALLTITRIPINLTSLVIVLCSVALALFATILTLERIRENSKFKHNENLSSSELVKTSMKKTNKIVVFLSALVLVMSIALICVPVYFVTMTALTVVVCLAAALYSYYLIGMNLHVNLLEIKTARDKMRLTRNPQVAEPKKAEKKQKTEKTQVATKKKDDKAKDKAMKEKLKKREEKENSNKPVV